MHQSPDKEKFVMGGVVAEVAVHCSKRGFYRRGEGLWCREYALRTEVLIC